MSEYMIRTMTADEVESVAVSWAREEGWNPGEHDASAFYHTDPKGFFIGLLDGLPIACISAVSYGSTFGFLGFYIVRPEFRGHGYGLQIWKRAMESMQSRNIGLDGVVAQQANYAKSGFVLAYRNIRHEGVARRYSEIFPTIVPFSQSQFGEQVKYDTELFPVQRSTFLRHWVDQPGASTLVSLNNGKINGYATIRKCAVGHKIGPLFADNIEIARALFMTLNERAQAGSPVYLDTPEANSYAVSLAEDYGMHRVFETARMYTRERPRLDTGRIFGVTTFELG